MGNELSYKTIVIPCGDKESGSDSIEDAPVVDLYFGLLLSD